MNKTNNSSLDITLVRISILLRLIFGPMIFLSPVVASVANLILDGFDGELYKRAGYDRSRYSLYDKILDYYWYIFIFIYILYVDLPFKPLFIFLFFFRTFGQIVFLITKNGLFLVLFPNIFEKFFYFYLITTLISYLNVVLLQPPFIYVAFLSIAFFSFFIEIVIHIKKMNFSHFYLGKNTYWPITTTNKIKAFAIFSLLVVFGLSSSYFKTFEPSFSYKSQAIQSSNQGVIVSYDRKGVITGWVKKPTNNSYQLLLFMDPEYKQFVCQETISLTGDVNTKKMFIFQKNCLTNLADNNYFLLLSPNNQKGQSYLLEFTIFNYQLK